MGKKSSSFLRFFWALTGVLAPWAPAAAAGGEAAAPARPDIGAATSAEAAGSGLVRLVPDGAGCANVALETGAGSPGAGDVARAAEAALAAAELPDPAPARDRASRRSLI